MGAVVSLTRIVAGQRGLESDQRWLGPGVT